MSAHVGDTDVGPATRRKVMLLVTFMLALTAAALFEIGPIGPGVPDGSVLLMTGTSLLAAGLALRRVAWSRWLLALLFASTTLGALLDSPGHLMSLFLWPVPMAVAVRSLVFLLLAATSLYGTGWLIGDEARRWFRHRRWA